MSDGDEIAGIMAEAFYQACRNTQHDLAGYAAGLIKSLESAGYVITRRSDEEQAPYGMMPVFKASPK